MNGKLVRLGLRDWDLINANAVLNIRDFLESLLSS